MTEQTGSVLSRPAPPEEGIALELPAEPASISRIRAAVRDFAAAHGAAASVIADIALAASEAATNALMHAFVDREPGSIALIARAGVDELIVNVADDGRGMRPRTDSPGMGIGLPTIGQVASGLDIRERPGGGTDVRMTFAAPGVRGTDDQEPLGDEQHTRLLAEVARLAHGGDWPAEGVDALVDLLVPQVADACVMDTVDDAGVPRRLAARVAGQAELTRWLADREPRPHEVPRPGARTHVLDVTTVFIESIARDAADLATLRRSQLAWWVRVPLRERDVMLGVLELGMRAERGRPGEQEVAFFELVGERASAGLASSRLMAGLRRTRRRLERILDALAEAITVHDATGQNVYANEAAARLLGARDVAEVLAARPGELAERFVIEHEDGSPVAVNDFPGSRLIAGRDAPPLLTRSVHRATGVERWLLTKATLLDDEGVLAVNIIEDVTEAKHAERRQRVLAEAGDLLVGTGDAEAMLQRLADLLVADLADWCLIDLRGEDGELRRVALAHADPARVGLAREIERRYPPPAAPREAMRSVLAGGEPLLVPELTDEMLAARASDDQHLRMLRDVGLRSAMVVPLCAGGRTLGAITLLSADSARAFDEHDLAFAADVARRAGVAVAAAG